MSRTNHITPLDEKDTVTILRTAQSAVTVGQVLKYYTDGIQVVPLAASDLLDLACGVCTVAAAAGELCHVVTNGVVDVNIDGNTDVAIADRLVAHGSTAGALIKDGTVTAADVCTTITPLEAQATDAVTLTMCKVNFR
jgi:hypothetical protein